ncbi:MAG TPA: lytic murein transglycosylase B [Gammaproteobacteria bacterium]|jgi:membrane-bound lytic murein transglycosylase B|nr:lytic murein transglycosylase B [Gammaproteobacteria bacterium]
MRVRLFIILFSILFSSAIFSGEKNFVDRVEVKEFIQQMVDKHAFNKAELTQLFTEVKVRPTVMKSVKAPLEQRPWYTYQNLFVTEWRVQNGIKFWKKYEKALTATERKYGVPASIIVATIGIETKYGQHTGDYPVIDALTNIGFSDSKRAQYFRNELEEFLLLSREQQLNPLKVMGSYAGAIGQPQFMPSSYRRYAVKFEGRGKIDLSHNELDVIASIANYYKQKGWTTGKRTAMPASMVNNKFEFLGRRNNIKILARSTLAEYDVPDKSFLNDNKPYKTLELQNYWRKEYWYTFSNFDVIKRYNSSDLYAMAVVQLSHYLVTLKELG